MKDMGPRKQILEYISKSKTPYLISLCLDHRMVRVIWATLSGWTNVDDLLDLILDLLVGV